MPLETKRLVLRVTRPRDVAGLIEHRRIIERDHDRGRATSDPPAALILNTDVVNIANALVLRLGLRRSTLPWRIPLGLVDVITHKLGNGRVARPDHTPSTCPTSRHSSRRS